MRRFLCAQLVIDDFWVSRRHVLRTSRSPLSQKAHCSLDKHTTSQSNVLTCARTTHHVTWIPIFQPWTLCALLFVQDVHLWCACLFATLTGHSTDDFSLLGMCTVLHHCPTNHCCISLLQLVLTGCTQCEPLPMTNCGVEEGALPLTAWGIQTIDGNKHKEVA